MGRGHDYLLRCKDCRDLVTYAKITKYGCCPRCGTRKFSEITTLTEDEMTLIQDGTIDFPDRDQFMKEFSGVE